MRQFLLVLPIDRMPIGTVYRGGEMPLHCTLMRWFGFASDDVLLGFTDWLRSHMSGFESILIESEKSTQFGVYRNIPVHTLVHNDQLSLLHTQIFRYLVQVGAEPSDMLWIGAGYRPHVTTVGDREFRMGMQHVIDRVVLVEQGVTSDNQVIDVFPCKNVRVAKRAI